MQRVWSYDSIVLKIKTVKRLSATRSGLVYSVIITGVGSIGAHMLRAKQHRRKGISRKGIKGIVHKNNGQENMSIKRGWGLLCR